MKKFQEKGKTQAGRDVTPQEIFKRFVKIFSSFFFSARTLSLFSSPH
jgi:hypothetical protein